LVALLPVKLKPLTGAVTVWLTGIPPDAATFLLGKVAVPPVSDTNAASPAKTPVSDRLVIVAVVRPS